MLTVGRRAVTGGSIEIARRVITRLGLSVPQPGRNVAILRSQARLPPAYSCQLVGPGILAVLGGLGAVFGRHLAVVDSLGSVVRRLCVRRRTRGTFAVRLLTLTRRAVPRRSVEVTRGVVTGGGLAVTLFGIPITHVRGQVAVPPFDIPLACGCQGVRAFV